MRPIKTKKLMKISLLASVALAALLGGMAYHRFHDDPEPDLSHRRLPEPDPAVVAETEAKIAAFKAALKPYAAKSPEDYDEDEEEKTLFESARDGNPRALRSLRRHLAENADALPHAEALADATRCAFPLSTFNGTTQDWVHPELAPHQNAAKLLLSHALIAAESGDFETAWARLNQVATGAPTRTGSVRSIVDYVTMLAINIVTCDTGLRIARLDSDPTRVAQGAQILARLAPNPADITRAADGDLEFFRRALPWIIERERTKSETKNQFRDSMLVANVLPNATVAYYDQTLDSFRRISNSPEPKAPVESIPKVTLFHRNFGGILAADLSRASSAVVHQHHLKNLACHRLARLAMILRAHQLTHDGKLPESLDAISAQFAPEDLVDPFGGAPLHYNPAAGIVWSIGDDWRNSFGRIYEDDMSNDIVVRISPPPSPTPEPES